MTAPAAATFDRPPTARRSPLVTLADRPLARHAAATAVALGILGDLMLRAVPLGINLPLCTAALLVALWWLARRHERAITLGAALLGALALVFAALMAWRDSPVLHLLDLLALWTTCAALAAALLHGDTLPVDRAGPLHYMGGLGRLALCLGLGAGPVIAGATRDLPRPAMLGRVGVVVRGAVLAAPALLVFALLLAAADPVFERLLHTLVDWDGGVLVEHTTVSAVLAWGAAGFLFAAFLAPRVTPGADGVAAVVRGVLRGAAIGATEACVAVALVDALFLAFVVVQLGWLFGGSGVVAGTGVTYAQYARRGFFELVAVAALVLPLLLGAHALVSADDARPDALRARRWFRIAAGTLLALVLTMMLSAADRMRLYQAAYGLTEARFYASAFMAWLAVVFAWAAATLLRDRAAPFALGALVSAWGTVLALHVLNPDARIVHVNTARAEAGRTFDVGYVARLSADAVPALVGRTLPVLAAGGRTADQCVVARALHAGAERRARHAEWRTWNAARARAAALTRHGALVSTTGCASVAAPATTTATEEER